MIMVGGGHSKSCGALFQKLYEAVFNGPEILLRFVTREAFSHEHGRLHFLDSMCASRGFSYYLVVLLLLIGFRAGMKIASQDRFIGLLHCISYKQLRVILVGFLSIRGEPCGWRRQIGFLAPFCFTTLSGHLSVKGEKHWLQRVG